MSQNIPFTTFETSLQNSWCFAGFNAEKHTLAFARVITDRATFAYLADVFVTPEHQGQGYSKRLLEHTMNQSDLQSLRLLLCTADAHGPYRKLGFIELNHPEQFMMIHNTEIYSPRND